MINLKELSVAEMKEFVQGLGLPAYRAGQILRWIYEKKVHSIEEMTDLSKDLRKRLSEVSYISNLRLITRKVSKIDGTEKYLFGLLDGESIESVLIPDAERLTLCISSQVGCAMGCAFCLTGKMGFRRNLKAYEIVDQIISVSRLEDRHITNIVLMGMGEPLMNLDEVSEAINRMIGLLKISRRKITLSTSGYVPGIKKLPKALPKMVNLAVSLNATTDEVRDRIMPINKKYPISVLIDALRHYPLEKTRRITFEYVLIDGLNDTPEDAKRLIKLLRGIPSKINLIPFNEYPGSGMKPPSEEKTLSFQRILISSGMTAFIRKSKGSDIMAACGQLKGANTTCAPQNQA